MQQPATQPNEPTDEEREAQRQEQIRRNQALIDLLDELEQEDIEDQRKTWEALERALREDPITFRTSEQ